MRGLVGVFLQGFLPSSRSEFSLRRSGNDLEWFNENPFLDEHGNLLFHCAAQSQWFCADCYQALRLKRNWASVVYPGQSFDNGGAAIPEATVMVTNSGTQGKRVVTTDGNGIYRVDGLQVGTYNVEVEKSGFKRYMRTGVPVTPGHIGAVDVTLLVGAVSETVDVKDTDAHNFLYMAYLTEE
jgi:hypothetical protein